MEVLEPPCITLKVKDARYADQVDACFNGIQMRTFVTQCIEDNKTLNRMVNDTPEALGKKARIATWFRPRRDTAPPPMSPEEMQRLGFDTYVIDQIDCPEGLLWYLESNISLHRTAIALNSRAVDSNVAMQAVSNPATGGSANFIVGRVFNQVQRSAYGQRLPTNTTRDIPPSKNFGGQTGQYASSYREIREFTGSSQSMRERSVTLTTGSRKPELISRTGRWRSKRCRTRNAG